jgi:hypothetical protein
MSRPSISAARLKPRALGSLGGGKRFLRVSGLRSLAASLKVGGTVLFWGSTKDALEGVGCEHEVPAADDHGCSVLYSSFLRDHWV